MIRTQTLTVPGREIALTLPMGLSPTPCPEVAPCTPDPQGLFWYSDVSGNFDAIAEAAYLLDPNAPLDSVAAALGMARVMGTLCGEAVTWTYDWTPETPAGSGWPLVAELGDTLAVSATPATTPGVLTVYADIAGQTFGPVALTLAWLPCTPTVQGLCLVKNNGAIEQCASPVELDPAFPLALRLKGTLCPGDTINWQLNTSGLTGPVTAWHTPENPTLVLCSGGSPENPNVYGPLIITATVTHATQTLGPFSFTLNFVGA